jgi:hypothetical protein
MRAAAWRATILLGLLAGCVSIPKTSVTRVPSERTGEYPNPSLLNAVLEGAVQNGNVSVSSLRASEQLTQYLEQLAGVRLEAVHDRQALLALWINAHNSYVLDILRNNWANRGPQSIQKYFGADVAIVAGEKYSLGALEADVIAKQFREPRAFFALYRGARSGPPLQPVAYTGEKLSEQLDRATREFLQDSTRNKLDKTNRKLYLSQLFQEHREHFERASGTLRSFVMAYASPDMREYLDQHPLTEIDFLRYDWTLP